jgi:plastocyanin
MKRNISLLLIFVIAAFGLALVVSACARLQKPVVIEDGHNVFQMTAGDFKFEPNNITTKAGDSITFRIQNTSDSTHNFTLTDPEGNSMQNVDIPPKQSIKVTATFSKPGIYKFHCNKPGHSALGMTGQVVATGG